MAFGQEVASFYATINADASGLKKELDSTHSALDNLQGGFGKLQSFVSTSMLAIGAAVADAATAVAVTGFQFNAMKEQSQIAFTTMLGSSTAAQAKLEELQDFAAKTPFEFPDLIRASQRMMAMGFASQEVIPTLTAVGDAVAALGGGQAEIDRVTTALGQMNAKGKTSAEEMMQLTEAGIPAWQMLADKIGVTVPEAMKMVTKGAVDARTTIDAVTEGIEQRFGGMMEAQSHTWTGMLSNIKDGFTQMSGTVMKPFFEMAKTGLEMVAKFMSSLNERLNEGLPFINAVAIGLAGIIPESLWDAWVGFVQRVEDVYTAIKLLSKPILDTIAKFISWKDVAIAAGAVIVAAIGSIVAPFAPVIAGMALLIANVAALRWAWENDFAGIRTSTQKVFSDITNWFYEKSGIWKGTWEDTLEYLAWWAQGGWKNQIFYPIRTHLFELVWEFNEWKMRIIKHVDEWKTAVVKTVTGWADEVQRKFTETKNGILDTYHAWADPILKEVDEWVRRTKGHFENWVGWIVGDFGVFTKLKKDALDIFEAILQWWDDNIQPWIDTGKATVQGLWDGVKEKWNLFNTWWQGVWTGSVDWVKKLLGIHSPSTVFYDIGANLMQGMANGIEASAGAVQDALANVMPTTFDAFTSLDDAIGKQGAAEFIGDLKKTSANAAKALESAGVDKKNPAFWFADAIARDDAHMSISRLTDDITALIAQLNDKGIQGGPKTGLYSLVDYLNHLTGSDNTDYTPLPSAQPGTDSTLSGELGMALLDVLKAILSELRNNGVIDRQGFDRLTSALGRGSGSGGYSDLVTMTAEGRR